MVVQTQQQKRARNATRGAPPPAGWKRPYRRRRTLHTASQRNRDVRPGRESRSRSASRAPRPPEQCARRLGPRPAPASGGHERTGRHWYVGGESEGGAKLSLPGGERPPCLSRTGARAGDRGNRLDPQPEPRSELRRRPTTRARRRRSRVSLPGTTPRRRHAFGGPDLSQLRAWRPCAKPHSGHSTRRATSIVAVGRSEARRTVTGE